MHIVTFSRNPKGKIIWTAVEDDYASLADARAAINEYLAIWKAEGDWYPVSVWPRQTQRGKVWRTRRIVHESGKTITCTIVTKLRTRSDDRHWAELSE